MITLNSDKQFPMPEVEDTVDFLACPVWVRYFIEQDEEAEANAEECLTIKTEYELRCAAEKNCHLEGWRMI